MKRKIKILNYVIFSTLLLLIILVGIHFLREPYDKVVAFRSQNISHYYKIRNSVLWEPVHSEFPENISLNPKNSKLYFFESHWLDFYGWFQLRLKLTPGEIELLYNKFDQCKIAKYDNIDRLFDYKSKGDSIPSFWTSDDKDNKGFSDDYMFMILSDTDTTIRKLQIHYVSGIAINKKNSEIIFWVNYGH